MWQGLTVGTVGATFDSGGYTIQRVFYYFDTSPLPATAQIISATQHLYAGQYQSGSHKIHVVPSTAHLPLTAADFGNIQYVDGGSVTSTVPNSWMEIPLNSNPLGWIVKGGLTKLALIHDLDLTNTVSGESNEILVSEAENTNPPYLTVIYTQP